MTQPVSEPALDWWDDELDALVKHCVVVFGEDATDDTVVRLTERHCSDIDDAPVREAFMPVLIEALKAEFRRRLTPH
jgi:hypothetical protein